MPEPLKHGLELDDFDRAILAALPDQGELIGKYIPRTMDVIELRQLVEPSYPTSTYATRVRLLHAEGYVYKGRRKGSGGRAAGWQRTAKGKLAAGIPEREVADG